jgi:hypothetical protein
MNKDDFLPDPDQQPDERASAADPLSDNLSRLLTEVQLPQLKEAAAQKILAELESKQKQMFSSKESVMASATSVSLQGNKPQTSRWNQTGLLAISMVLTLSVVIGLVLWNYLNQPLPNGAPGFLAQTGQDKKQTETTVRPGKALNNTQGNALSNEQLLGQHQPSELTRQIFSDGTVLIAQAGSIYSVESLRKISLKAGEIFLIVTRNKEPFEVTTNEGHIRASGTRFYVSANLSAKQTSAAVAQGTIELDSKSGQVELKAGEQGTLADGEKPTRQAAPRLSYLVSWARDALAQDELLVDKPDRENGLVAVDPSGQESKLSLRKYNVDIYIEDGIARTTIDQTFFNHQPWNTEGTFYFPLPRDASVSRLAMYVAGNLNEGGMVSRERGQQIYNEILYQQRDPALLEMMEGNIFKMRIFPLEGRQEKRIFLSYTQKLDELYGTMRYWFPMDHTNSVAGQLSINVRVKNGAKSFDPRSSTHDVKTEIDGDDLIVRFDAEKTKPDHDFLLHLIPATEVPETRVATCEKDGKHFLFARIQPKLKGEMHGQARQWYVLNDISASRSKIESAAQRYILGRLIEEADDDDTIFLIDLNTRAIPVSSEPVSVHSPQAKLLVKHVAENIGACNIEAGIAEVKRQIAAHQATNPQIVLLGDGVATDGERDIAKLPDSFSQHVPFIGIGVGKSVDSLFMQAAADKTGGFFTTINPDEDIDWRVFDLVSALNTPRMNKIDILLFDKNDKPVNAIAYPSSRGLSAGETLTVVARYDDELPSELVFRGEVNGKTIALASKLTDAKTDAQFIPRFWAKRHIDELLKSDMPREEEITALSKEYYVVTPYTSLIVLEDDAMYEQYGVERGRKDHWALYDAPKKIEVVREEIDWNRYYWYGYGQGEDAKIKATTQPKTVQEIVDSMQMRINAPFYFYPPQAPQESRANLYALAGQTLARKDKVNEAEAKSAVDPARLLTFWYLLAAGQHDAIRSTVQKSAEAESDTDGTDAEVMAWGSDFRRILVPHFNLALPTQASGFLRQQPQQFLFNERGARARGTMERFGREKLMAFPKYTADFRKLTRLPQMMSVGGDLPFAGPMPASSFFEPRPGLAASMTSASELIPSELNFSFSRAMQTRMSRINRDIENYNRQYGNRGWDRNWNGSWSHWSKSEGIDLKSITLNYWNDGLEELQLGEEMQFPLPSEDFELSVAMGMGGQQLGTMGGAMGGGGFGLGRTPRSFASFVTDGYFASGYPGEGFTEMGMGLDVAFGYGYFEPIALNINGRLDRIPYFGNVPPAMALISAAQSQASQPAMVSVMAADYLEKRRAELLEKLLDEQGKRELQAIETALANIESAAARLEDSTLFWNGGWGYQPRMENYQVPQIQAWNGYSWTFDLTQYVDGFYTSETDMLNEVAESYGKIEPRGKVSDDARKRIDAARQAIAPVRISFAPVADVADSDTINKDHVNSVAADAANADYPELYVAAGDRFAMTSRNSMYLTQRLICDGHSIWQVYDELGLAARRTASPMRMEALRAAVPHLLEPADAMAILHDVELIAEDAKSFTLKLTPVVSSANKHGAGEVTQDATQADLDTQKADVKVSDIWMNVRLDNTGRLLEKMLFVDGKRELQIKFDYESKADHISIVWLDKEGKELGTSTYAARNEMMLEKTFAVEPNDLVVIDMPLRKSDYYAQRLAELGENQTAERIRLSRHQALAAIQDLEWRRWGQENELAKQSMLAAIRLQTESGEKIKRGDVVLLGSAGAYDVQTLLKEYVVQEKVDKAVNQWRYVYQDSPLIKFFQHTRNQGWNDGHKEFKDEHGLVGHLAAYQTAYAFGNNHEYMEYFEKQFGESPLMLALAERVAQMTQSIETFLKINRQPQWSGTALLMAINYTQQGPEQNRLFAKEFWRWRDELKQTPAYKAGFDVILNAPMAAVLNDVDSDRLRAMIEERFAKVKASESLSALLDFAEQTHSWGQADYTDSALKLAEEKLATDKTLVSRVAMGQAYWTCGRYQQALAKYDAILKSLQEKNIAASPALLATVSRIASQAGETKRAIELEEQSLAIEQKYLPEMVNLNAYNQRYSWLWTQYQQAIETAKAADDKQELKSITAQAYNTWLRWQEVDYQNLQQPANMASLLQTAGADDQEIWNVLSTAIDRKPRDAVGYVTVANWFQQQQRLDKSEALLQEAYRWDTANPQWLVQRADILQQLNRKAEAVALYKQVVEGQWAPALQGWVQQSQAKLNELN